MRDEGAENRGDAARKWWPPLPMPRRGRGLGRIYRVNIIKMQYELCLQGNQTAPPNLSLFIPNSTMTQPQGKKSDSMTTWASADEYCGVDHGSCTYTVAPSLRRQTQCILLVAPTVATFTVTVSRLHVVSSVNITPNGYWSKVSCMHLTSNTFLRLLGDERH